VTRTNIKSRVLFIEAKNEKKEKILNRKSYRRGTLLLEPGLPSETYWFKKGQK
jgi:hypothetical protein